MIQKIGVITTSITHPTDSIGLWSRSRNRIIKPKYLINANISFPNIMELTNVYQVIAKAAHVNKKLIATGMTKAAGGTIA